MQVWKRSYNVEVRRVVLSMLGCNDHKRFLSHGSMEQFLHHEVWKRFLHRGNEDGCTEHVGVHRIPYKIPMHVYTCLLLFY